MISLIVCSVNPEMFDEFKENVDMTIGVEHEIIAFDNREKHWGLCKVYNHCISKAKYQYLCFVHEDMYFFTKGWGKLLIDFHANTPECGVIGFAGSQYVAKTFVQWKIDRITSRVHTCISPQKNLPFDYNNIKRFYNSRREFDPVVVLDGMFLFTSKKVCNEVRFDEKMLGNFHIYDTDFTFSVSQKYNNFVCSLIDNMHRSKSNFSKAYVEGLLAFHNKWHDVLPKSLVNLNLLHSWLIHSHEILDFSYAIKNNSYTDDEYRMLMNSFCPRCHINAIYKMLDYFYGKVMNIKIRKIHNFIE